MPCSPFKPPTITRKKGSLVFHRPCRSFPCRLCTTTIAPSFSLPCSLTLNHRQIHRPHLFPLPQITNRTQTHSTSFLLLTTSNAAPPRLYSPPLLDHRLIYPHQIYYRRSSLHR
ncbi:hypothetical protein ES332_D02G098900v1 [Gossypium tomentosum]|uniref:Uncharacterized protein n=1 Tax=Gossypium tomentosum TaxID=34277 RepID=A0A5D2LV90_GOSTO|nr:hypothetical protein ES332_D02G098900v1 [Gossypium tomentosum]